MDPLTITVEGDELMGLHALLENDKTGSDPETVAKLVLRRGLASQLAEAGLSVATQNGAAGSSPLITSFASPSSAGPGSDTLAATTGSVRFSIDEPSEQSTWIRLRHNRRVRMSALTTTSIVVFVLLVGGYGNKWSWTGFTSNNQLWDWLELLLLPIALGTFPLWLRYGEHMSRIRKVALTAIVVAFGALVAAGYLVPMRWTGFQGNTLWNWLTLIVLPLAIVTAQAWPSAKREIHAAHIVAVSLLLAGWLLTLVGGYGDNWTWTGYQGNTLWDWLSLLLGPIAISTILIPAAVRWVSGDVERYAEEEEEKK